MVKSLKKLKTVEYFASFFIVCVFCVAVGKYYYPHIIKNVSIVDGYSIFDKSDNDIKIEKNAIAHDFKLVYSEQGDLWQLLDDSGGESQNFVLARSQDGDNISIHKKNITDNSEKSSLIARVSNVHTYYSQQNGPIETEIPFDYDAASFRSFEQEDVVPIMGYHFIVPDNQEIKHVDLEITQSDFRRQVKFMTEDLGCRWFTTHQIMNDYILNDRKVPQKACVMNFDDGRRNNFTEAFPVLEEFGVKATFYVITDRINSTDEYMTWAQVDMLHKHGHEIGSHTINSGSLVDTFGDGDDDAYEQLKFQTEKSLALLRNKGYGTTTFAYPRGEWNPEVVQAVKNAGYVAARAIRKKDTWRDMRTVTIGHDDDFIWHMHYIKPEGMDNKQLRRTFAYDGWWQFEENYYSFQEELGQSDIRVISSIRPTDRSYAVVSLKAGQDIANVFRVSRSGQYDVEFLGALSKIIDKEDIQMQNTVKIYVDDKELQLQNVSETECIDEGIWHYCTYGAKVDLTAGEHVLTMKATTGQILLDKFHIYRDLPVRDTYDVKLVDVVTTFEKE